MTGNKIERTTALPYLTFRNWETNPVTAEDEFCGFGAPILPQIDYRQFYEIAMSRIRLNERIDMGPIFKPETLPNPVDISSLTVEERQTLEDDLTFTVRRLAASAATQHQHPDYAAIHEGTLAKELAPYLQYPDLIEDVVNRTVYESEHEYFAEETSRETELETRIDKCLDRVWS